MPVLRTEPLTAADRPFFHHSVEPEAIDDPQRTGTSTDATRAPTQREDETSRVQTHKGGALSLQDKRTDGGTSLRPARVCRCPVVLALPPTKGK
jgi:hypothetical protein